VCELAVGADVVAVLVVAPVLDADPADAADAGAGSALAGAGPASCCGCALLGAGPTSEAGGGPLALVAGAAAVAVVVMAPDEPAGVCDTPLPPAVTPLSPACEVPVEADGPSAGAAAGALVAVGAA
jgi:hypothetical protein